MSNSRGIGLTAERVTLRTVGGYTTPERALLYGYLSAAYFADGEEEWEDDEKEWSAAAVDRAKADCAKFLAKAQPYIDGYCRSVDIPLVGFEWLEKYDLAGHDFWMTRRGHGVGFWDGDWDIAPPANAVFFSGRYDKIFSEALTAISKTFRAIDLYLGDDDLLYFM